MISSLAETLIVLDAGFAQNLIVQIMVTDTDGQKLSCSISHDRSGQRTEDAQSDCLVIDTESQIALKMDVSTLGGKVLRVQVEVIDGLSVSSAQFQLGFVLSLSKIANQGLARSVYNHASIRDDLSVSKQLLSFPNSPSSTSIEASFRRLLA